LPNPSTDHSIVESVDGGDTWRAAATGLPDTMGQWGFIGPDGPVPASPAKLFFATFEGGGFQSRDNGLSWQPFNPGRWAFWAGSGRTRSKRGCSTHGAIGFGARASHRSCAATTQGASWRPIFAVENTVNYASIAPNLTVDPARKGRLWLTGLQAGVYVSEDGGASWRNVGFGADFSFNTYDPQSIVAELVTSPDDVAQVYLIAKDRLYRGNLPPSERIAVEYQHDDRFWITADPAEAGFMDYRQGDALRSGEGFGLWSALTAPPGAIGICRFQGNPASGQHSRFITLQGSECEAVKRDTRWVLEGQNEWFAMPPAADGSCAAGLVPVTRFFNGKADANHRYVADVNAAAQMRARGWIEEGIAMCARALVGG
jgi:hypothetical protein